MNRERLERVLRQVYTTRDEEIDCNTCFDQVSDYVDLEIASGTAAETMPELKHHLDRCGVCREEYETLRDLARLAAQEELPSGQA